MYGIEFSKSAKADKKNLKHELEQFDLHKKNIILRGSFEIDLEHAGELRRI